MVLLSGKSKKLYEAVFEKIIERANFYNLTLNPKSIQLDFEASTKKVLETLFPRVRLSGCNFHLAQILLRRIQKLKYMSSLRNNRIFFKEISCIKALAFLPKAKIPDVSEKLLSTFQSVEAKAILDWFTNR